MDSPKSSTLDLKETIRAMALDAGFEACGFAAASVVEERDTMRYDNWIAQGKHDCMEYAARYRDVRHDPALLLEGAKTVISVAMNYYPARKQSPQAPQFAYYAYGRDYHSVVKERLRPLADFIGERTGSMCRICCDTAPIRERYWAAKAGIGFIGRNNMLIVPGKGSFFFLGEIVTTLELPPDEPCALSCGDCGRCLKACPMGALCDDEAVDARRCLSCQLIERRGPLPAWVAAAAGNRVYGCDTCQLVCPHNAAAQPTSVPDFAPSQEFLVLDNEAIASMTPATFSRIFGHSAVKRARLEGLRRNASILDSHK